MKKVISVRFKDNGKTYYFDPADTPIKTGDYVIVETARGVECGEVVQGVKEIADSAVPKALKPITRMADSVDVRRMRQMIGGLGICGQPFCCSRFLKDFQPVSIKMAKEQGLSLNPTKISGACGRLMCCLAYEESAYEYLNSIMPMVGSTVRTPDGLGTVLEVNPISGYLRVRCGTEAFAPRYYKVSVCEYISGGKRAPRRPDPDDDYSGVRNPAPVVASANADGTSSCPGCGRKDKK